jgi:glycosyltransferase involved in cell wall biosynthesis
VIIGLASALSRLNDGDERYLFLVDPGHSAWLEPFVFGSCSFLGSDGRVGSPPAPSGGARTARKILKAAIPKPLRVAIRTRLERATSRPDPSGLVEMAAVDVMHFPMQVGFRTAAPTIFAPHDLQHLHLPEFFSPAEIADRETRYRELCAEASIVTVMSTWGKDDIIGKYGLPAEKITVVPGAATIEAYELPGENELAATRDRLGLPDRFALYPAKAWPHKNHLRLVTALQLLRRRGVDVPVVLTGAQAGLELPVLTAADALGVRDLIHFVGFVTPRQLGALYRLARMMIFPSLFEGWGLPILEALTSGLPLACSNVTCLPAVTAGAAEVFDPYDPAAIAQAVERVWQDDRLRVRLIADGRARAALFSWDHSARMFRACYRMLGGRELSAEDKRLLDAPPLA